MNSMNWRPHVARLCVIAVILAGVFAVRYSILGGSSVVKLNVSPPLGGLTSQALGPNESGALWSEGKDYTLKTQYLENNKWAVVSINPNSSHPFDPVTAIFEKTGGTYQLEAGPSGVFSNDVVLQMPNSVINYLFSKGLVYGSVPE